jgi:RNA polymerase sigma-70 factor (ECF subfamily)
MQNPESIQRMTIQWTRAQPAVGRFIRGFVRDRAAAEDVLQEVALVVVDRFEAYDNSRPFIAWALGIARNVVLSHLRSAYRDQNVEFSDAVERVAQSMERMEPQAEQMKDALADCIGGVRGRSRQVLQLRYTEGLGLKQIAERMEMTSGNIGVLMHRVRAGLRDCIERRMESEVPS